jgi:hypothetical protein
VDTDHPQRGKVRRGDEVISPRENKNNRILFLR